MPQSMSSSLQGYHGSERSGKSYEESAALTARRARLARSPAEALTRFACDHARPPLAFREPITAVKSTQDAMEIIKDFDSKMRRA
ncbi:hypothetical protein ACMFMG_007731 [Clarireedia jacksonii]